MYVIPVLSMHRTDPDAFWEILSGANYCKIVDGGRCVTDGSGDYGNSEICRVKALQPLLVTAKEFHTAECVDFVTVNDIKYIGNHGPQGVFMARGAIWTWQSDISLTSAGFTLCASASKGSTTANIYKRACQLSHDNTN